MRSTPSPRMNVVKKEDKEAKIREFIESDLASRREPDAGTATGFSYLLLALSPDSPVARALAALSVDLQSAGISIQAVFARSSPAPTSDEATGLERIAILRHAPDARLLDAHEQLVLGPTRVWVGDCMRRDPAKRDAYECYAIDSADTAVWAKRAFDHVWTRALPVRAGVSLGRSAHATALGEEGVEALIAMGDNQPSAGATRH